MDTYMMDHLRSRHLDIELHKPVINEQDRVATFFLYNLSGKIVGYQQYRPDATKEKRNNPKEGRYFTYSKVIAVFGLESFHLHKDILFVTEGIFDAARITDKGFPAIAVLSNDPAKEVKTWLRSLGKKIIVIADNDTAGRKLVKFGHASVFTKDKDLGESSDEFVSNLIQYFSSVV